MSDPTAFSGQGPEPIQATPQTAPGSEPTDETPTRFVPVSEGATPGAPQAWTGPLSGARFTAEWDGGYPVLSVTLEAEIPLQLKDAMKFEDALIVHSDLLDLALKVSLDNEIGSDRIRANMIGLVYVRDYLRRSHTRLVEALGTTESQMDPSAENKARLRRSERSIASLDRLSSRLEARIAAAADPRLLAGLEAGDPSPHWH